jgi:formylglycine-generating enzyme required for sulfatase activity
MPAARKASTAQKTVPVKSFPPNDWGLYEMHGNVWEWCADGLRDYDSASQENPRGPEGDAPRVVRGGSWLRRGRVASLRVPQLVAPRPPLRLPGLSLFPEVHQPGTGSRRGAPA